MQIAGGIAWAAYELGFLLMFFETLPAKDRTRLLTYFNFANTLAFCCGATVGAGLLSTLGCTQQTYFLLFGISSVGRLLCLGILAGGRLPETTLATLRVRILGVRPSAETIDAPVFPSAEPSTAAVSSGTPELVTS